MRRVCGGHPGQGPWAAVQLVLCCGVSVRGLGLHGPVSVRFRAGVGCFQLDARPSRLPPCSSTSPGATRPVFQGSVCISDRSVRGKGDCRNEQRHVP